MFRKRVQSVLGKHKESAKATTPPSTTTATTNDISAPQIASAVKLSDEEKAKMPTSEVVEEQFKEAVKQMGIRDAVKLAQLQSNFRTTEQKWHMVLMMLKAEKAREKENFSAQYYVEKLKEGTSTRVFIQTLAVELRTQPTKWLQEFIRLNGIMYLTNVFAIITNQGPAKADGQVLADCVSCFYSLLNCDEGIPAFVTVPEALEALTLALGTVGATQKTKSTILFLLAAICYQESNASSETQVFEVILGAMSRMKLMKNEERRFISLVAILADHTADVEFKINCLIFLNSLLGLCSDILRHAELQKEFRELGIVGKLEPFKGSSTDLDTQINIFTEQLNMDLTSDPEYKIATSAKSMMTRLNADVQIQISDIMESLMQYSAPSASGQDQQEPAEAKAANKIVNNLQIIKETIKDAIASLDESGMVKNHVSLASQHAEKLRIEQQKLANLESKLKLEKQALIKYVASLAEGRKEDVPTDLEFLKDVAESVSKIKFSQPSAAPTPIPSTPVAPSPVTTGSPPPPPPPGGFGGPPPPPPPPGGLAPPPPPPPGGFGGPPPPPPPGGFGNAPPPPPPPGGFGGPPPPPPPGGFAGPPPPPPPGGLAPPPPPGFLGGPPPPPGMGPPRAPGAPAASMFPALPAYIPKSDMRNINIDAIVKNNLNKSIFIKKGIAQATHNIKLDTESLEQLFSIKKKDVSVADTTASTKKEIITLIDSKRAYNISIQLNSLRVPFPKLKQAIVELDEETLGSKITVVMAIVPTEEEISAVEGYDGDVSQLGEPEKFFLTVKDIPVIQDRISTWNFTMKFASDMSALKPDIESILLATKEVSESKKFSQLLTIVLAVTNFLNSKGRQKNSYGFKLSTLAKLADTKTTDNKSNLLNYIIEYIEKEHPDILDFASEMPSIISAKRASVANIKETLGSMKKSLTQTTKTLAVYEKEASKLAPEDKFVEKVAPFAEKAKTDIEDAQQKFEKATKSLEEIAELFDEDKAVLMNSPEEFFTKLDTFFTAFSSGRAKLIEAREKEEKKRKMEEAKQAKQAATKPVAIASPEAIPKLTITSVADKASQKKGLLDDLNQAFREGNFTARRGKTPGGGSFIKEEAPAPRSPRLGGKT